jgi:tetratricopeptide (TPR) repeat protein
MKSPWRKRGRLVAAALLVSGLGSAQEKAEKPAEPFFHQFLIPGEPLDEKLLEQEKRVAENPDSAALRNDFGNLLAERRFPEQAREEYKKASKLDRHFFLAAYNLGMLEETEGRSGSAISAYREAIHRRPGFPPAHFRLGRLYEKLGHTDEAVQAYAKALRIDPSLRDPRQNPLVVDSRLMDQASLVNYSYDVARVTLGESAAFVDAARLRPLPIERPLDTGEVVEEAGPQTIETSRAPATGIRAPVVPTPSRQRPERIRREAPRPPPEPEPEPTPIIIEPPEAPTPEPER